MPFLKTLLFVTTLASLTFLAVATSTACPPTSTSQVPGIVATPVNASQHIEPLPSGAKIIATRVLTPSEVATRQASTPTKPASTAISTHDAEPKQAAVATAKAEKKREKPPVKTGDVVDLQTDEEIEVDVRFAEETVGSAILISGDFETELEITDWKPNSICLRMPTLGILKPMNVRVALYRPDGHLVRQFDARLIRRQSIRRIQRRQLVSTDLPTTSFPADLPN